ncbi:hypothetical protein EVAR_29263_1 [Eumeta japonica]|uniref:Uncharacterized protein n=1 Tax=Eumeta variegata TaxID=151549 RepID=A0A4C1VIA7_EUMVA|nr:hypothetical protein EVAR_29263_1 [Eumeta japonica]
MVYRGSRTTSPYRRESPPANSSSPALTLLTHARTRDIKIESVLRENPYVISRFRDRLATFGPSKPTRVTTRPRPRDGFSLVPRPWTSSPLLVATSAPPGVRWRRAMGETGAGRPPHVDSVINSKATRKKQASPL